MTWSTAVQDCERVGVPFSASLGDFPYVQAAQKECILFNGAVDAEVRELRFSFHSLAH
jgi:hypothetical protein